MTSTSSSSQQPHVVQAIFDSLTRCFNPIDGDESPFSNRCPRQPNAAAGQKKSGGNRRSNSSGSSSNHSSSNNDLKSQYDADRYLHRKLEIFRTNTEDLAEMGIDLSARRKYRRSRSSTNTLVESVEDEIANLTNAHKRTLKGCGALGGRDHEEESPVASFVKLLRDPFSCITDAQRPFGLCFATPIREAGSENIDRVSDWNLTEEEFEARQRKQEERDDDKKKNFVTGAYNGVPDIDESSASMSHYDEEETITSASYFDQKYSHIVEENPPMPLFQEQRIAVSASETDEILKMVKLRQKQDGGPSTSPPRLPSRGSNSKSKSRTSPTDHIVVKKNSSARSKNRRSPSQNKTSTTSKNRYYDLAPVAKSSSVSTECEEDVHYSSQRSSRMREPDIMHSEI